MTRDEFLGKPRIIKDFSVENLRVTAKSGETEPFMDKYEIGRGEQYVVTHQGNPIAQYDGRILVVDFRYRHRGIATELVYDFRTRNPHVLPAKSRTKVAQHIQEKVWDRMSLNIPSELE